MLDLPEKLSPDVRPTCSFWDDGRVRKALAHIRRGKSGWTFKFRTRGDVEGSLSAVEYDWTEKMFELPSQYATQPQRTEDLEADQMWKAAVVVCTTSKVVSVP
ncbi:hypothetical protein LINPERHAP1_LOCUS41391 [Linum perenne]